MEKDCTEAYKVKAPSRRDFISKTGILTGGALLGYITLLNGCDVIESLTKSQSSSTPLPTKISRVENLPGVTAALSAEKQQLNSFSVELRQFQNDMDELDTILAQLSRTNDTIGSLSEEMSLKLQMYMDRRSKIIQTLSNIMSKMSQTTEAIVANIK
jgi:ABC-type transporter Mla subunit MlaD